MPRLTPVVHPVSPHSLEVLQAKVVECRRCARLVEWREQVAKAKVKRFSNDTYWGRAVPGFGDPRARLYVLGLAPGAHGANRTGRMFTGDRSGDWLFRALHRAGFANQPSSVYKGDGLVLTDCYIGATCRCAPPDNKPLPEETANCRGYLLSEISLLTALSVVITLGKLAFDAARVAVPETRGEDPLRGVSFGHGVEAPLAAGVTVISSYHPSQQNTFTGKLTEKMLDQIFYRAREIIDQPTPRVPLSASR